MELQDEDYARARREFRTSVPHPGPSPQQQRETPAPPGATAVEYLSGAQRLRAYLGRPVPHTGRHPAVLYLHNGFAFGNEDWDMARPFLDAGFVVLVPVLRGENGQPGTFTLFYDEVDDVLAAAEFLARQPSVDPARLFVAGHSEGGTLTLLAAMTSDRFRAAASFSGPLDLLEWTRAGRAPVVFDRSDLREFQMRSPLAYATSFKCPVRLYYGEQETAQAIYSRQTAERARGHGLDVEAVEVPGDHFSSVSEATRQAIAFFGKKELAR
jgi:dipeptidyl aminopeptidase/acylaminoacyl peptidase